MHSHLPTLPLHQQPWPPKPRRGKLASMIWQCPIFALVLPVCKCLQAQSHRCFQVVQTSPTAQKQSPPLARHPPACSCPTTSSCACLVSVGHRERGERAELNWGERKKLMIGWTSPLMQLTLWPHRCLGRGWLGGKMAFFAGSTDLWWVYLMQKLRAT